MLKTKINVTPSNRIIFVNVVFGLGLENKEISRDKNTRETWQLSTVLAVVKVCVFFFFNVMTNRRKLFFSNFRFRTETNFKHYLSEWRKFPLFWTDVNNYFTEISKRNMNINSILVCRFGRCYYCQEIITFSFLHIKTKQFPRQRAISNATTFEVEH